MLHDYYGKEYLRDEDRAIVDEIDVLREDVLNDDAIDEFVESKVNGGAITKGLVKEQLALFSEFLKERIDFHICDFIIGRIDDYPSEEFDLLKRKADEVKRLKAAGAEED